jgi:hypothetical protein
MSSVISVSWCVLCGLRVPREVWDGIPVLIDVYGYNLVERSVRTGCEHEQHNGSYAIGEAKQRT